ncbi:MAG: hypothetical protein ACRDG7_02940 [Candidatus Limnocylindria bacterium]
MSSVPERRPIVRGEQVFLRPAEIHRHDSAGVGWRARFPRSMTAG